MSTRGIGVIAGVALFFCAGLIVWFARSNSAQGTAASVGVEELPPERAARGQREATTPTFGESASQDSPRLPHTSDTALPELSSTARRPDESDLQYEMRLRAIEVYQEIAAELSSEEERLFRSILSDYQMRLELADAVTRPRGVQPSPAERLEIQQREAGDGLKETYRRVYYELLDGDDERASWLDEKMRDVNGIIGFVVVARPFDIEIPDELTEFRPGGRYDPDAVEHP